MKLTEAIQIPVKESFVTSVNPNQPYYHGTNASFTSFNVMADRVNRSLNVSGAYFTPREYEAKRYGDRVIEAYLNVSRPFIYGRRNMISDRMMGKAKEVFLDETRHPDHWIESAILPSFKEEGQFKSEFNGISGDGKRDILLAGGYDSYIDGDHIVVLNPSPMTIDIIDKDV